jgi:hypothetical protein
MDRLTLLAWVAVLIASGCLAVDTALAIQRIGLTGTRPELSVLRTNDLALPFRLPLSIG